MSHKMCKAVEAFRIRGYKALPPFTTKQLGNLWALIDRRGPDECWPWLGSVTRGVRGGDPYGLWRIQAAGATFYLRPHRVTYTLLTGPIPDGFTLDHIKEICGNTLCCNPAHVEPVTQSVNSMRRTGATETLCTNGHTRIAAQPCLICKRAAARKYSRKTRSHSERKTA